ncbi:MAG: hypothetical protein KAV82_11340 [Phycisphaerae bacterium]|nr:hypothetical protein [Phycisphaerae bacterium]
MTEYTDRSPYLRAIGVVLLAVGVTAAFFGPVEVYCFYLFSSGGRFHYEGFGFGSLMFGNIACQIAGYYLIAALFIPLGYGHLKLRRWARTLSLAGLWVWLIFGVPALVVFLAILGQSKRPSLGTMVVASSLLVVLYTAIPAILIALYRGRNVRLTFDHNDPGVHWTEKLPLAVLVLCFVLTFYVIVLHVPLLFNGLFALPGVLLSGLPGFVLIDVSILCLVCLIWGAARLRAWAWWGALMYFGFMTVSLMTALFSFSVSDVVTRMAFAPKEIEALQGVPLQLYHLTALVAPPLVGTFGLLMYSRRHFAPASHVS